MIYQKKLVFLAFALFFLPGCGAMTGIPSHGGGKRFAVEQEMVATATRDAIKQIDLTALRGKKVNLFVSAIGDTGAGNLVGGRYSIVSGLRGDYIQAPVTETRSVFPRYNTTTNTTSTTNTSSKTDSSSESTSQPFGSSSTTTSTNDTTGSSSTESSSLTSTVLPYPEYTENQQKGAGGLAQLGVEYKGMGAYHNSEDIVSTDLQYLTALLQSYLYLQGVYVVPPSEAEVDVYVTVDVFGTVRSRLEWFLANNEILRARTSLEVLAIHHLTGVLLMGPQVAGSEAEYNEQYILWAGPIVIRKTLEKIKPLMSDFTNLETQQNSVVQPAGQEEPVPYPFRYEIKQWREKK